MYGCWKSSSSDWMQVARYTTSRQRSAVPMIFSQYSPHPFGNVQRLWRYRIPLLLFPTPPLVGLVERVVHSHRLHLTFCPCHTTLETL
uniref:Uncharacterized protein n=1 Tax=Arundo donax TaxID=35708 RepID=A0A0A9CP91_ARUDO